MVLREINNGNTHGARRALKFHVKSALMASINFVLSRLPARDKRIFMEFRCPTLSEEQQRAIVISMKIGQTSGAIALFRAVPGYKFVLNHSAISVCSVLIPCARHFDQGVFNCRVFSEIKLAFRGPSANNNNDRANPAQILVKRASQEESPIIIIILFYKSDNCQIIHERPKTILARETC